MVLAAAAVVFLVGFLVGHQRALDPVPERESVRNPLTSVNSQIADRLAQPDAITLQKITTAVARIGVNDGQIVALVGIQNESQTELLPVIESPTLAAQYVALPQPKVPSEYSHELAKAGWRLNCYRQFLSLNMPNGENQIRPFDMFNYRFVGRSTF